MALPPLLSGANQTRSTCVGDTAFDTSPVGASGAVLVLTVNATESDAVNSTPFVAVTDAVCEPSDNPVKV